MSKNRFIRWFRGSAAKYTVGGLLSMGVLLGIIFWGGFNTALEATNTESFCISCHEMEDNVYVEYQQSAHYSTRTGVRASCPDCHVPKQWTHKMIRKIEASREVYHWILGTIDTPEKFNDYRPIMAQSEWTRMKETNSRECRNCHSFEGMDLTQQGNRASVAHQRALKESLTCIDCHKGIAHKLPDMSKVDEKWRVNHRDASTSKKAASEDSTKK